MLFGGSAARASVQDETTGLTWHTDLTEAHKKSQETGLPIFGFFTGSDWCGWCIKLQRDVFVKQAFIDWAKTKVVLLELDFPRRTVQTAELKKQNQELQQAFQVSGYPTVWLFRSKKDAETGHFSLTAIGKLGYPRGGEIGKEEVKFLAEADAVLVNDKPQ